MTQDIIKEFDKKFGLYTDKSPTRLWSPSWQEWKDIREFLLQSLERQAAAIINEIPDNFYACCGCSLKSMKERLTSKYVRN
jgi:hypothetical protein